MNPRVRLALGVLALWSVAGLALWYMTTSRVEMVLDTAQIFSKKEEHSLGAYHTKLRETYDIDYRVVTSAGTDDLNVAAHEMFESLGVGSESSAGRGLLLLIDPESNAVRLEVSGGLDAVYTDAFVSYIQTRQMIPFFQANRVADGILATTEMIFTRAQDAEKGQDFMPPTAARSIGAGVTNPAQIGARADQSFRQGAAVQPANMDDPFAVLAAYQQALEARNGSPDLPIYSTETKAMLKKWVVTPAQMDNEARSLAACPKGELKMGERYAVIRKPIKDRQCAPYFFIREADGWKLNFAVLQKGVRFNHLNEWHLSFADQTPAETACVCHYMFAFDDWALNSSGYPTGPRKWRWNMNVGTTKEAGTVINSVGEGSAAAALGFLAGDRVLEWESVKNPHYRQIIKRMDSLKPGESFTVVIERAGKVSRISGRAPPYPAP